MPGRASGGAATGTGRRGRSSGVASASASASRRACCRAIVQALTTPMAVSEASAYATGGIAQIARSRQPGPEASTFMPTDVATAPMFRNLARIARLPFSASAMPSVAKISAATSGMPASRAATAGST